MVYLQATAILIVFAGFAALMVARVLPALLALPAMAIGIALVAGTEPRVILDTVISGGAVRLSAAIAAVVFGGILAQVVRRAGVADAIVKRAAELSGENAVAVALAVAAACVLLFMALSGLGAVILVASLAFPVLLAVGVRPISAAGLFLVAMSVGGILNVANWQFYMDALGLPQSAVRSLAVAIFVPGLVAIGLFVALEVGRGRRLMWAVGGRSPGSRLSAAGYLTPVIPILLVLAPVALRPLLARWNAVAAPAWEFPVVAAMLVGVLWGVLTARRPEGGRVQLLSASVIEGIRDVAPAIGLMIGIGMLFTAVSSEPVKACLVWHDAETGEPRGPLAMLRITSPVAFVVVWTALAPLALYRGPLNVWGMGIGIAGALVAGGVLPPAAAMAGLMAVGQVQGICDPTNTHNVWVAGELGVDTQDILRRTLPYAWGFAAVALAVGAAMFHSSA